MFPPGEAVSDEESQPQCKDQLREEVLDVEEIAHDQDGR